MHLVDKVLMNTISIWAKREHFVKRVMNLFEVKIVKKKPKALMKKTPTPKAIVGVHGNLKGRVDICYLENHTNWQIISKSRRCPPTWQLDGGFFCLCFVCKWHWVHRLVRSLNRAATSQKGTACNMV